MIKAIFAVDSNGGIAKNGIMPWPRDPSDLKRFKNLTTGHAIIMGKKTWDAVDMPSPLPNRYNVVVTTGIAPGADHITTIQDLPEIIEYLEKRFEIVWIIGGAQLLVSMLDQIQEIYLTDFVGNFSCDTTINMHEYLSEFTLLDTEFGENKKWEIWSR